MKLEVGQSEVTCVMGIWTCSAAYSQLFLTSVLLSPRIDKLSRTYQWQQR
jgi:hypothetical protein